MSDREKKLVLLFGLAAFILINVFGVSKFRQYRDKVRMELKDAQQAVTEAQTNRDDYDTRAGELEWMDAHRPEPKARQNVETELEQFASREAQTAKLTIKKSRPLESVPGNTFHRARLEFLFSGSEMALYSWLGRLRDPEQFRAVTFLRLSPDAKDDTIVDGTVNVEQWFIPEVVGQDVEEEAPSE